MKQGQGHVVSVHDGARAFPQFPPWCQVGGTFKEVGIIAEWWKACGRWVGEHGFTEQLCSQIAFDLNSSVLKAHLYEEMYRQTLIQIHISELERSGLLQRSREVQRCELGHQRPGWVTWAGMGRFHSLGVFSREKWGKF